MELAPEMTSTLADKVKTLGYSKHSTMDYHE